MRTFPRAIMLTVLLGVLPAQAQAASIEYFMGVTFDHCTEPSLCDQYGLGAVLQPGGTVDLSFPGQFLEILSPEGFGIAVRDGVTMTVRYSSGPYIGEGDIGPFGTFTHRWDGPQGTGGPYFMATFSSTSGPFTSVLDPFMENEDGFFVAAHVVDIRTGTTGFIAGNLDNVLPVPEPGTMLLFASGLAAVASRVRRNRSA